MKKIGFIAEKGGAGKTTQSYNFAGYLAAKNKKVLLIDLDHQLSLTREVFGVLEEKGSSVNLFRDQSAKIYNVKNNIDLLPASLSLELLEKELALTDIEMPSLILSYWFQDHAEEIDLKQYDYIIFDTHPDFGIVNKNVVVASDAIISPLEPNLFGWAAKVRIQSRIDNLLEHLINPSTRKPFIETPLFFINNKVEHNTNESRTLLEKTENDPQVIATIPNKQLFKATIRKNMPIADMQSDVKIFNANRKFFDTINMAYADIENVVDKI
ncbi:Sporulation initiation inhibitor protein Soj [Fructobacillus sp. EFB-N1]|uniref:ParA family protein n=1 Tax=Fructobacillus sp. EFB-N1 TaxID=1658766 RepID=UPI00064D7E35|nr:ParA family protein [Fructobacillus sp. EFB-N1]KMK53639.1 Sporulation initiation inhibitor protein Soj [Fructobacillus sp. EFB-N1]